LVARVQRIARYSNRIAVYNQDAREFVIGLLPNLRERALIYLDPPYYVKGQEMLYANYYEPMDHDRVSKLVKGLDHHWVVSYDDVDAIRHLYDDVRHLRYGITYSANSRQRGPEVMFFANSLQLPPVDDPPNLGRRQRRLLEVL